MAGDAFRDKTLFLFLLVWSFHGALVNIHGMSVFSLLLHQHSHHVEQRSGQSQYVC